MGPKINGMSITQLVSTAVEKRLAEELGVYKDLLDNALTRIKTLEEEMAHFREMSNNNFPISRSHSKNAICRHINYFMGYYLLNIITDRLYI